MRIEMLFSFVDLYHTSLQRSTTVLHRGKPLCH